jgi:hypothetical protein
LWTDHDGRSFGSQPVADGPLELNYTVDWFNYGRASWRARFSALAKGNWTREPSFIFYFATQV